MSDESVCLELDDEGVAVRTQNRSDKLSAASGALIERPLAAEKRRPESELRASKHWPA